MSDVVRAGRVVDEITGPEGSVALVVLGAAHVAQVSPLGSAVLELARDGMPLTELATHLTDRFGPPPGDALASVRGLVDDLVARGLAEWVESGDPAS